MSNYGLLDAIRIFADSDKYNNSRLSGDAFKAVVEEASKTNPEARELPFAQIGGTRYDATIRTGLPTVGWRRANQGVAPSKSKFEERSFPTKILSGRIECDIAVADSRSGGRGNLVALETIGTLESALKELGRCCYAGEESGTAFPGLIHMVDDDMIVDADGTGNERSSVWFVRTGERDVRFLLGGDLPLTLSDFREETLIDAEGKKFPGIVADLTALVGLQCLSRFSVGRIANLTTAKPLTDDLGFDALLKFPAERLPNFAFLTKRSLAQLRDSRKTALNPNPPVPTEIAGVPIRVTDSLTNTETN